MQAGRGVAEVERLLAQAVARGEQAVPLFVEGDRGKGRWMVTEHGRTAKGDNSTLTMGMYADEYVRVDGRWYFRTDRELICIGS